MYKIYCHLFPNGKRYVGITKTSLEKRFDNGKSYKTCPLMDRAIQKYGWENIEHIILDSANTKEDAENKERFYISKYKTTETEFGYNILPGGDVATNKPTKEMRYKLGKGWRGKHHTPEQIEKIRNSMIGKRAGEKHHLYGKKMSEETRKKMSESHFKRWKSLELKQKQSTIQKELWSDEKYRQRQHNSRIGRVSPNKGKKMSDEFKEKISIANKGKWLGEKSPCSKKIKQFTKDGVFECEYSSQMEAERVTGVYHTNIAKCCKGKVKSAGGYIWEYS
jgi:group I intron endonuclease